MTLPSILNDELFKSILLAHTKDETISILKLEVEPGSQPGEQFMSLMYKIKIVYESIKTKTSEVNWILKLKPMDDGSASSFLKEYPRAFETEIEMYEYVLPLIKDVLLKNNISWKLAPDFVHSSMLPVPFIVLEDVSLSAFGSIITPLNLQNSQEVLRKLAIFHAASLLLDETKFESKIHYERGVKENNPVQKYLIPTCEMYIKHFEQKQPSGFVDVINALKRLETRFEKDVTRIYESKHLPSYKVLIHGDFSVRNLLFKSEQDLVSELLFIDFQLSQWGTPAIDIFYFLYTVVSNDVRVEHRDTLIHLYYTTFKEALTRFNYSKSIPSMENLQTELESCKILEAMLLLGLSVFQYADFKKLDMQKIVAESSFYKISLSALENQKYIDQLIRVLNRL